MKRILKTLSFTFGTVVCLLLVAPSANAGDEGKAVMNFVDADIVSVVNAIGQYTDITFVVDPRVKGTVNLVSEKPLDKSQAFEMLASVLRVQGYAVVQGNGFFKVVPESDAKLQLSPTQAAPLRGDQITTRIFPLNYESAANLVPVLRPLISPNNTINVNPGNNTLVITDYAENLKRLGKMIATLDVPAVSDLDVIPIRYGVASDIAVMTEKLLDAGTSPNGVDAGRTVILADSRTNSVIVRAPSPGRANFAKSLIAKLDQPTVEAGNMHVVYLKNADAVRLAATLRAIVAADPNAIGTAPGSAPLAGAMQQATPPAGSAPAVNVSATPGPYAQAGGKPGTGFIQADATTNTLIITASEPVYRNLRGVIDQLDTRRAQVYVEALIVEVTDTVSAQLGVQWLGRTGESNNYRGVAVTSFGSGGDNIVNQTQALRSSTTTPPTGLPPSNGLTIGILHQVAGKIGLSALATALDGKDGSNVLSMPNLLTLDNEEARIIVGQNVPFITGSYIPNASGSPSNPFQTVERKDVGVALRVRPHVSEGGTVRMEISQEVSSVDPASINNSAGLTTNKRSLDTNVVMDDGAIIVLGGLIGDSKSTTLQKVPLLGDIPGLGYLFKYESNSREKTNLMVFLRPTVIRNREQSGVVVTDRYDYMRQGQLNAEPASRAFPYVGPAVVPPLSESGPFMKLPQMRPADEPASDPKAGDAP